jgi:catechol 2,3-dioxygenase-like lactoylglutathione lyase family enzyme
VSLPDREGVTTMKSEYSRGVDAIPIVGLDHVVLRVTDLERALGFYTDVLGLRIERELPPEIGLVQLRAGAALIDLVPLDGMIGRQGGAAPGEGGRNMDHFCLQVEPFDERALRAHLERHGIEAGPTAQRYGAKGNGPSIYIRDPDGNTVELKGLGDGEPTR